jgi:hypothetical protein
MEYYSAVKKNQIMSSTGKWMELEIIMLNKINQTQKDKYQCLLSYVQFRSKDKGPEHKWEIIGGWDPVGNRKGKLCEEHMIKVHYMCV